MFNASLQPSLITRLKFISLLWSTSIHACFMVCTRLNRGRRTSFVSRRRKNYLLLGRRDSYGPWASLPSQSADKESNPGEFINGWFCPRGGRLTPGVEHKSSIPPIKAINWSKSEEWMVNDIGHRHVLSLYTRLWCDQWFERRSHTMMLKRNYCYN